jgi:hypothetical protein
LFTNDQGGIQMGTAGYDIHDMLNHVMAEVDGRVDSEGFDKTASAEEMVEDAYVTMPTEEEISGHLKIAEALTFLADGINENPRVALLLKSAASGEPGKVVGGGARPADSVAPGGRQAIGTASASQQTADSGLVAGMAPGKGKTHVKPTEVPQGQYGNLQKLSEVEDLRQRIMQKLAGSASLDVVPDGIEAAMLGNKARISQSDISNHPNALATSKAGEGNLTGQPGESLISSNESVISATKRAAKKPIIQQMRKYLKERALSAKTDNVLQQSWKRTGEAGAKIASAEGVDVTTKLATIMAKLGQAAQPEEG